MSRLIDKVAVVTGAGSGIGHATALKFAAEGASVVIGNRNQQAGGKASFYQTDVTNLENGQNLIKHTVYEDFKAI